MKTIIAALVIILCSGPGFAQMAPPVSVVQPGLTGAITSGASQAVNPRLDQDKIKDEVKAAPKPATDDKTATPK